MKITLTRTGVMVFTMVLGLLIIARIWTLYQPPLAQTTAQAPQVSQVHTAAVTRGAIQQWLPAYGIARAVRREMLRFEIPRGDAAGKVTFIKKDEYGRELREGDQVRGPVAGEKRGQLLAAVDDQLFVQERKSLQAALKGALAQVKVANAELKQAQSTWMLKRTALQRARSLHARKVIPQGSLDEAQTAFATAEAALTAAKARLKRTELAVHEHRVDLEQFQVVLDRTRLYAPFDGIVAYLNLRVGDYMTDTEEPASILLIDPAVFEVTVELPPWDGVRVQQGQTAQVSVDTPTAQLPRQTLVPALVHSVSPAVSEKRRMIRVRLRLEADSATLLRDGQYVNARIRIDEKPRALLIPFEALVFKEGHAYVFVVDQKSSVVALRRVRLGIQGETQVEILDGLVQGESIVRQGQHRLVSGAKVQWTQPPHSKPPTYRVAKPHAISHEG